MPGREIRAASAVHDVVHRAARPGAPTALAIEFEVVRVAGHHHFHLMFLQELMHGGEGRFGIALVVTGGVQRMPENGHGEFAREHSSADRSHSI